MTPNYRRCISCRKVAPKESFWRVVRDYRSRQVQLDRGVGRSAYLCPQANCLESAQRRNRLGRSLQVSVPESIYQRLWSRLASTTQS
ncbi:MAG: YlxR family protein [Cyanophyceae cyanobacterium]